MILVHDLAYLPATCFNRTLLGASGFRRVRTSDLAKRTRREEARQARKNLHQSVTVAQAVDRSVAALADTGHSLVLGFLFGQYVLLDALASDELLLEVYPKYAAPAAATIYALLGMVLMSAYRKRLDRRYEFHRWAVRLAVAGEFSCRMTLEF